CCEIEKVFNGKPVINLRKQSPADVFCFILEEGFQYVKAHRQSSQAVVPSPVAVLQQEGSERLVRIIAGTLHSSGRESTLVRSRSVFSPLSLHFRDWPL